MSKAIHTLLDGHDGELKPGVAGVEGSFPIDEAVIEVMPTGTKVVSAEPFGNSAWTITGCVQAILPDGTPKAYFLKCASEDRGRTMMLGEFTSITTINTLIPGLVPTPRGWGKFKAGPTDTYFFLSDFIDMEVSAPEPIEFTDRVAELHHRGTSPNGMFGFPVTTCDGKLPHTVDWESSWAIFFAKMLRGVLKLDIDTNGPSPELEAVAEQVITKVVPRLCGVLQSEGRQIKASVIHGDLWSGNVGTIADTGEIIFFDAGSYYAHNEMESAFWRCKTSQHLQAKVYITNYQKKFKPAEPVEEWEDRSRLYSLKYHLNYSAGHPGNVARQTAYNDMCYLCEKYAPSETLGKYDPHKDPHVTGSEVPLQAEYALSNMKILPSKSEKRGYASGFPEDEASGDKASEDETLRDEASEADSFDMTEPAFRAEQLADRIAV